jgi:hypothetical protein
VLAELEARVQLKASWTGGGFTRTQWRKLEAELALLRNQPPFEFRTLPSAVFQAALRPHRKFGKLALPLVGSPASRSHGGVESLKLDDA